MGIALQMGDALGVDRRIVAELMPDIGVIMAAEINKGDS